MDNHIKFIQGNGACVEAALYAGLDFFAGYPITPSSEITEFLASRLPRIGAKFMQMEDEISSLCAIIGASLTGRKVMTATSGPGFSLMQEGLGYAIMTEIPCVIVNVQRGGPSTGLPTKVEQGDLLASLYGSPGDSPKIIMAAATISDCFHHIITARKLAEAFRALWGVEVTLIEAATTPLPQILDPEVGDIVTQLAIPAKDAKLIFINGVRKPLDTPLADGDRLGIFPPVGGG